MLLLGIAIRHIGKPLAEDLCWGWCIGVGSREHPEGSDTLSNHVHIAFQNIKHFTQIKFSRHRFQNKKISSKISKYLNDF